MYKGAGGGGRGGVQPGRQLAWHRFTCTGILAPGKKKKKPGRSQSTVQKAHLCLMIATKRKTLPLIFQVNRTARFYTHIYLLLCFMILACLQRDRHFQFCLGIFTCGSTDWKHLQRCTVTGKGDVQRPPR